MKIINFRYVRTFVDNDKRICSYINERIDVKKT